MKSHVKFDWQNSDLSVQDQVGSRFKIKQENEMIKKKYTDRLDRKIYHKYVEHEEEMPFAEREMEPPLTQGEDDTLAREVQHFNSSKVVPPEREEPNERNPNFM
jgi:hypothetical protein